MDSMSSTGNPNPKPNKPMMAFHFIRALAHIHQRTPNSSLLRRSHRINRAAYASMAFAAGPRRSWSRALLRKLRGRQPKPRRVIVRRRRARVSRSCVRELNRVETLRSLVPGGNGMDFGCLLQETASYMQCLSTQVILMQGIVDSVSPQDQ